MDGRSRRALEVIRDCVSAGRFLVLPHFQKRMVRRGVVWPDVQAILDAPTRVRSGGRDGASRPKWLVAGMAADGLRLELVCVLDEDEGGQFTVFITIY